MYQRLRAWLLPPFENSHVTYTRVLEQTVRSQTRWLDLGCGHSLVPDWLPNPPAGLEQRAVGIDADLQALKAHRGLRHKVGGNAHRLPFRDSVFDVITANMVVEHITEPHILFRELRRVLRPGGRLLIHTPNAGGYTTRLARIVPERIKARIAKVVQQRQVEDVYPAYYRANSEQALQDAGAEAGLELVSCEHVLTSPQLFRVPFLVLFELLWLRRLAGAAYAAQRPVLIATLVKRT